MKKYGFGVDVGGTTVKLGLFEMSGSLVESWEIPTRRENDGSGILPDIAGTISAKIDERGLGHANIEGVGLGVPGPVLADGTVKKCVNLGWGVFNVEKALEARLDLPVRAGNDANVAALGEQWQGGGRGYKNLVMVTLGTGVGGGIILNGKIVPGAHGAAGEIGHLIMRGDEREVCGCGKRGHLEQYASATGEAKLARRALSAKGAMSVLQSMDEVTCEAVFTAAKGGDELALRLVDEFCRTLATGLANVADVVDPEVFVIGGGVSRAGEILRAGVEKHFKALVFHACEGTRITLATLGADAGIYGAAGLLL